MPRHESSRPLAQRGIITQVVQWLWVDLAPERERLLLLHSPPGAIVVESHHGLGDPLRLNSGLVPGVLAIEDDRHPL